MTKNNVSNIKINNFGIINKSDINIAPLTVFIGPNSSGKSFISRLIHCFNLNNGLNSNKFSPKYDIYESYEYLLKSNVDVFNKFNEKVDNYLKNEPTLQSNPLIIPKNEFYKLIKDGINMIFTQLFEQIVEEQFEEQLDDLINFNEVYFKIGINSNELFKNEENFSFETMIVEKYNQFSIKNSNVIIKITNDEDNILINLESIMLNPKQNMGEYVFLHIYDFFVSKIFDDVFIENSYYIPAERSEITMDKKLLSRTVKNQSDLSKNQSDVLANILDIDTSKRSPFYELGCEFEEEFSGINADIYNNGMFNDIVYKSSKSGKTISSRLLSTSIHELTLFSLYMKYILKEGDLLIIEEPEAHLHPRNQRILVKYFIRAINKGLKIMLTTHSDYIIDQINNLVRLNSVDTDKLTDLNFTKEDVLKYGDINIYNFKKNDYGAYDTYGINIDDYGFTEDNFSEITDELYDETINIIKLLNR